MKQLEGTQTDKKLVLDLKKVLILLLTAAILAVFLDSSLSIVLGPFMAVAFAYLYFFGYTELVTAIIIVGNDALGTIFMGLLSFPYLLLGLVIANFFRLKKIDSGSLFYSLLAMVLLVQLFVVEYIEARGLIYSATFILALITLPRKPESTQRLVRSVAYIVVLIGIHTCLTGGVAFYELSEYSEEILRKGIIGVGSGDANFSSFLLLIGMVCLWNAKELRLLWKIIFTGVLLYSILITLSVTGLLALVLISTITALMQSKKSKAVVTFSVVILAAVILLQVYMRLPSSMRDVTVDGYIARVEEKIMQIQTGNISRATTNRSNLVSIYTKYIFSQPVLPLLFGGNSLIAVGRFLAHNTFIGLILQVGLIGAGAVIFWMVRKLIQAFANKENDNRKVIITLKALSLFVAFTLSIHNGSLWSLWFYIVVVL